MNLRADGSQVVIAHDYLTQRGGAERVVLTMARAFPEAPIVTSVYDEAGTYGDFRDHDVRTTGLQRIPRLPQHHRLGLPLYAGAFTRLTVDAPLTICSTSGWAHGTRVTGLKALYVHNTPRWVYQPDEYLMGRLRPARALMKPMLGALRDWNRKAAQSADKIWVNSKTVQERVLRHWSLESEVLYPPFSIDPNGVQDPADNLHPGYLLAVSRLLHYKRVDVLVEAVRQLPEHRLVVVGNGPEAAQLMAGAPQNCIFFDVVTEERLRWLYANCLGLVSAAHEDLGLTALECMAFGKPVAVVGCGGYLETVREGITGTFFETQTAAAAAAAFRVLAASSWSSNDIAEWADQFSEERFIDRLRAGASLLIGGSGGTT